MNPRYDQHRNMYEDPLACLLPWWDMMKFFLMFPSNSVLVFLRSNIGYRLMRPWIFGAIFLFLWLTGLGGFAAFSFSGRAAEGGSNGGTLPLLCYTIALGGLAIFHRRRGWKLAFRNNDPIHTMSRGDSHLVKLLPMVPEWIIQRYVEPYMVMLLGMVLLHFQWTVFGLWLMVSGLCLAAIEAFTLEATNNFILDGRDAWIEANMLRQVDDDSEGSGQTMGLPKKIGGIMIASPELLQLRKERLKAASQRATQGVPSSAS